MIAFDVRCFGLSEDNVAMTEKAGFIQYSYPKLITRE